MSREITLRVYNLNELPEAVKQNIINEMKESDEYVSYHSDWLEPVREDYELCLAYMGLSNVKITNEDASAGEISLIGDYSTTEQNLEGLADYAPNVFSFYQGNIGSIYGNTDLPEGVALRSYQLANTTTEFEWEFGETEDDDIKYKADEELNTQIGDWLSVLYESMSEYIAQAFIKEWQYILSDDAVADYINTQGYEFLSDGTRFNLTL